MANTFIMRREGMGLVPIDQVEAAAFDGAAKYGPIYKVVTTEPKPRSLPQNNTYWWLLNLTVENWPESLPPVPTKNHLSDLLQLELGWTTVITLPNGFIYAVPQSKSFKSMKQDDFNKYFNQVQVKLTEWLGYDCMTLLPELAA